MVAVVAFRRADYLATRRVAQAKLADVTFLAIWALPEYYAGRWMGGRVV